MLSCILCIMYHCWMLSKWLIRNSIQQFTCCVQLSDTTAIIKDIMCTLSRDHLASFCSTVLLVYDGTTKFQSCALYQYGLWSFQMGYTKLERICIKINIPKRKLLNFENWTNGEPQYLAKIRGFRVDYFEFSCIK